MPKTRLISESKEGKYFGSYQAGTERHLHSVVASSDLETFIAADSAQINLWSLERSGDRPVYNLIDNPRKKAATENDELVTRAKFCPSQPMFLYTTSKGHIRVCDFRESSNFSRRPTVEFSLDSIKKHRIVTEFDKWLMNVSDASFVPGKEHLLVARDYLYTTLWDMRVASSSTSQSQMIVDPPPMVKPIYRAQVTEYIGRNLNKLYQADSL